MDSVSNLRFCMQVIARWVISSCSVSSQISDWHETKKSSIRLFHASSSIVSCVHFLKSPWSSSVSSGRQAWIALRKLLLHEYCGLPVLRGRWIQAPNSFFGIILSSDLQTFPMYLTVHHTMKALMSGIWKKRYLTSSFVILSSLTLFQVIPRILLMAEWWKLLSFFLLFFWDVPGFTST